MCYVLLGTPARRARRHEASPGIPCSASLRGVPDVLSRHRLGADEQTLANTLPVAQFDQARVVRDSVGISDRPLMIGLGVALLLIAVAIRVVRALLLLVLAAATFVVAVLLVASSNLTNLDDPTGGLILTLAGGLVAGLGALMLAGRVVH